MTLITEVSKVPCIHWILTPESQISIRFALLPAIFEIQACQNSKCTKWPQNDLNHWSDKSTLCTVNTHPQGPNLTLFRSTTSRFRDTGFSKIERTQWTQNYFNHLSVKSTLYTLNTPPRGPNFTSFCSTTSRFRDTVVWKSEMDRMTLITEVSKAPCVHRTLTPEAQISLCFSLRLAILEIHACRKSDCTKWPQNDLNHWSVKSTLCKMNTHSQGPNVTPFRPTVARFPDNWGFLFPHKVQWWI